MTWLSIGALGIATVGGGLMKANGANKASALNYEAQSQQEEQSWTRNLSDNQAIQETNLANTIRTGYKTGLLNVQRAQAKVQAIKAGNQIGSGVAQLTSNANANSAAAGQVGSSVDAVLNDIKMKAADAHTQIDENYVQQEANFDTQLHDILQQGSDAVRASIKANVSHPTAPGYVGAGEAIAGGLINMAGTYASQNMGLGLGSKSTKAGLNTGPMGNMGFGDALSTPGTGVA